MPCKNYFQVLVFNTNIIAIFVMYLNRNKMTTQDLATNRDRIITKIQSQMTGDATAHQMMVKPVMAKMVAYLNRPEFSAQKATLANIDKLTSTVTLSWIKNDYNHFVTMNQSELNDFSVKREEAKRSSHSTFN